MANKAASPTFVAKFTDGVVTRMTTFCVPSALDLPRGIALSLAAYDSRTGKAPPPIIEAHFELPGGGVLQRYDAQELGGTASREAAE